MNHKINKKLKVRYKELQVGLKNAQYTGDSLVFYLGFNTGESAYVHFYHLMRHDAEVIAWVVDSNHGKYEYKYNGYGVLPLV